MKLPSLLLIIAFLSFTISCSQKQRRSTGAAFAVVGVTVSIGAVRGLQGSSADDNSNDKAAAVLVGALALVALGAIVYADAK